MKHVLLLLFFPVSIALAQNPVNQAYNFLRVYELSMEDEPNANNEMALESLYAAKEAIDQASEETPYSALANTYLIRARIYTAMLTHPKGNPEIDRSRPLTIEPAFEALKQYESLTQKNANQNLWRQLLKQTFILAFEAEERLKERKSVELTLQGAYIIAYLQQNNRDQSFKDFDDSFAGLFVRILRRDISNGNLLRAGSLIPLTKEWYPENGDLWLTYVNYYLRNDQRKEALEAAKRAIPLNEKSVPEVRAQLYFTAGNLAVEKAPMDALEYYKEAARIDSNFYGAQFNIGVIYARLGRGAAEQAMEVQNRNPQQAQQLVNKKNNYFKLALPYLEKAYHLKPSATLKENISNIYMDLDNPDQAKAWRLRQP